MNEVAGWITLGAKMDTSKFDKQYQALTKKAQDQEMKINIQVGNVEKVKKHIEDLKKELNFSDQDLKETARFFELDLKSTEFGGLSDEEAKEYVRLRMNESVYQEIQSQIEKNSALISGEEEKLKKENETLHLMKRNYNNILQEIENIESARDDAVKQQNFQNIKQQLGNIGNSIKSVTRKVVRWGLAIFGIRSAFFFVRQAMSTLSQYDQQLAVDIQYIRFALAMTLERFIKPIVEWVYKILQYVNYLTMAWFNLNLFEKATVNAFNKTNKSAEKLKKTLAGFDEMNILNDESSNADNIGGIPSQDLSNIKDFKPPKWLEWIKDHGEEIKNIIIAIGVALGAIKFAELLVAASELTGALGLLGQIGVIAIGVELLYTALTGRELISDIKEIIKGLEDLKKIRDEQDKQAKNTTKNTKKMIKAYNDTAKSAEVTKEQTEQYADTLFNGITANNQLIDSMEKQKSWLGQLNGDNEKLTKSQKEYNKTIDIQLEELGKLYDAGKLNNKQKAFYISQLGKQTQKLVDENDKLNKNSEEYKKNAEKIRQNKTELENLTGKKYEVRPTITPLNTSTLETELRNFFNYLQRQFSNLGELKIGFGWGNGGGGFRAKGGIYYPKLAVGGIINKPGSGVPYHGATIGERGAEAVVPLTDTQQMALLGEAIGKYITINATVINSMNGRVLSREIQKVQNESNFAMNR